MARKANKSRKGSKGSKVEKKAEDVTLRLRPVEPVDYDYVAPTEESNERPINILAKSEDIALSHVVGSVNVIFGLNALRDALRDKVDKKLKTYYEDALYRAAGLALLHYEELIRNHDLTVEKILTRMFDEYRSEYDDMRGQNASVPNKTDQEIMDVCAKVLYTVDQIHKKMTEDMRATTESEEKGDTNAVEQKPA